MKPEERMALLKELVKIKPGTIDERRRAKALLRSLAQGRDYRKENTPGNVTYHYRNRPAIGRSVVTGKYPTNRKTSNYDISFYSSEMGVHDKPFKGGLKNSKLKALKYMLGQALDKDVPSNNMVNIDATDDRRLKAYERDTKGAFKFKPYSWSREGGHGGSAQSYKNKAGNYQPIVDGKFTKSAGNPGDALRSSLIRAATALEPFYRNVAPIVKKGRVGGADPINAIMIGADVGKWMRDNLKVNTQSSGRGSGRTALND